MTYSYTQIAQYLRCPRSYRYRYLDGWKEKDSRATLLFGRCFEQAFGAYFHREDSGAALFSEWAIYKDTPLEYSHGDTWERMLRQGIQLLERLAQDDRIEVLCITSSALPKDTPSFASRKWSQVHLIQPERERDHTDNQGSDPQHRGQFGKRSPNQHRDTYQNHAKQGHARAD
jgi:PD-(D/E)XK nuclease superfamily